MPMSKQYPARARQKLVEDTGKIVKSIADLLPNGCSTNVGGADLEQAGARS